MKTFKIRRLAAAIFFSLFLCLTLGSLPVRAAGFALYVNPYGGSRDSVDTIMWKASPATNRFGRTEYVIYLPADCDSSKLTVYFDTRAEVKVNGTVLRSGDTTDVFAACNREYTLRCGATDFSVLILRSENVPAVFLSTETGSLSALHADTKDYSERGAIRIYEQGEQTLDAAMKGIKLRGNNTRKNAKKPYTITLYSKESLCGMEKAKKWVLVANWEDYTLLRNHFAQKLAGLFGLAYSPESRMVDLYINGEYRGSYQLFEKIELGENRIAAVNLDTANKRANLGVDMEELPTRQSKSSDKSDYSFRKWVDIPNDPEDISGAYLLELELGTRYLETPCSFVTANAQPVVLKSPKYASEAELNYIADLFSDAHAALVAEDGYNEKGKHYSEYFDLDSLARMYILEEYTMNIDAGLTSAYFLKLPGDDKLYAVAPWDFDHSLFSQGTMDRFGVDLSEPYGWFAAIGSMPLNHAYAKKSMPTLFQSAMRHGEFRELVIELWTELSPLAEAAIEEELSTASQTQQASAVMDAFCWGISYARCKEYSASGSTMPTNAEEYYEEQAETYLKIVKNMQEKCRIRLQELNTGLSEDSAILFFAGKNGEAYCVVEPIQKIGATITVPGYVGGKPFIYRWNTRIDGSGKTYDYQDTITLTERSMTLYAG